MTNTNQTQTQAKQKTFSKPRSKGGYSFGVGINDMPSHETRPNGKNSKFYALWSSMVQRSYSKAWKQKWPTYKDTTMCDEWLTLSMFKKWFDENYVDGWQLDKDLLGNNHYSPETSVFLPKIINVTITEKANNKKYKGTYPYVTKSGTLYRVQVLNSLTGKSECECGFKDVRVAALFYRQKKHVLLNLLVDQYKDLDKRAVKALRNFYRKSGHFTELAN